MIELIEYLAKKLLRIAQYVVHTHSVIKTFKHKGLQKFFDTVSVAAIQSYHKQKLRMRLTALDTAPSIEDMNLPGFRLHPLKGDRGVLFLNFKTATYMLSIMRIITNGYVQSTSSW